MKKANDFSALEFSEALTEDVTKILLRTDVPRIFIAGDSTACNYPHSGKGNRFPRTGWGQVFGELFTDGIQTVNCAISGRSSLSFRRERNYPFICDNMRAGDHLIIQFAHNDSKAEDVSRYTSPGDGSYQASIYEYINAARRAGAEPILCTSVTRCIPSDRTLEPYADAMKAIAAKEDLALLDIYSVTHTLLLERGDAVHGKGYMRIAPHDERFIDSPLFRGSEYYENGSDDSTHLNITGAREVASIAASELKRLGHALAGYLR